MGQSLHRCTTWLERGSRASDLTGHTLLTKGIISLVNEFLLTAVCFSFVSVHSESHTERFYRMDRKA